jgi:5-methylcytosine-specific restriction protein A
LNKGKFNGDVEKIYLSTIYKGALLMSVPTKSDFIDAIKQLKTESRTLELKYIEILSADLHRKLGYYPGPNHRMTSCCDAMYDSMDIHNGDLVVLKPPKGRGAKLKIRYYL